MKHLRHILPVMLTLVMATLACSLGSTGTPAETEAPSATEAAETAPAATEAAPPATQAAEEETPLPATEVSQAPTQAVEGEGEETELDLQASLSDLEDLNSYRVAYRFDWEGTKGGQPVDGFMEMESAYVREPPAQELHFQGQGFEGSQDQGLGEVTFVQVGDTAWFYESESESWMQVPAGDLDFSSGMFFKPEDLLKDFDLGKGRRSLLPQEANGVRCTLYTFDENDFDLDSTSDTDQVTRAEGQVCVAVDGGYVVQLIMDADMRYSDPDDIFDEGNVRMTFDVSDVNQPIDIQPPAEAEAQTGGRSDIPMLADADVDFSSGDFISYHTASSIRDAAQFYEAEMPAKGWTAKEDENLVLDETAILNYNKGDETVAVMISKDEQGTNVLITFQQE